MLLLRLTQQGALGLDKLSKILSKLLRWVALYRSERGFEYLEQNESIQYIDTARSVAVGAGHRGYMVNWIQGHELGRKFRALVTHDGIVSMTSPLANNRQHSVEDIGGPIWETPDEWMKLDPAQLTVS